MIAARRLCIHGRVQGVWYRGWAVTTARSLALVGWVRNRRDGTVEAFVQGDVASVERFIALAHEGSPHAEVIRVDTHPAEPDESLGRFEQVPTA